MRGWLPLLVLYGRLSAFVSLLLLVDTKVVIMGRMAYAQLTQLG